MSRRENRTGPHADRTPDGNAAARTVGTGTPPPVTTKRVVLGTLVLVALIGGALTALYFVSRMPPTLREVHKGYGRANCTVCHPPAKTHPGVGYKPDSCPGCHGPNGAKRTTDKHKGWKRQDCFASGCHAPAKVHVGIGFTLAGCAGCHGANGADPTAGAAK